MAKKTKTGNQANPSTYEIIYRLLLGEETQAEISRRMELSRSRVNNIYAQMRRHKIVKLFESRKG